MLKDTNSLDAPQLTTAILESAEGGDLLIMVVGIVFTTKICEKY